MLIPLSLSEEEARTFRQFAKHQHQTLAIMIKSAVNEKIQTAYDWEQYKISLADYEINRRVFTLAQVKRECGIR